MKTLTDYIHARGLKAGIYASPGPLTCAHFTGSYQHEQVDARTFAEWGFDFLKYDWCSYTKVAGGQTLEARMRPYQLMGRILKDLGRDVVFNLCQYGMSDFRWSDCLPRETSARISLRRKTGDYRSSGVL